jgi:translocation and assembly module TamB
LLRFPLLALLGLGLIAPVAVWLVIQTSWAREQIRTYANTALAPLFLGKIEIDRLGQLGLWGAGGIDARIFDPQGRQVIRAQGLSAHVSLPRLLLDLIRGPPLTLHLSAAQCDHLDVALHDDEEMGVSIGSTFLLREPSAEDPGSETTLDFSIPQISVQSLWAHGVLGSFPAIDGELRELSASLRYSARGFELSLEQAQLLTRGLPYALDPEGALHGQLEVPMEMERPLSLRGRLLGSVAQSPAVLEASLVGDDIDGWLHLSAIPDRSLNDRFPGLAIQGDTSLSAEVAGTLPKLQLNAEVLGEAGYGVAAGHVLVTNDFEAAASLTVSALDLSKIAKQAPVTQLDAVLTAQVSEPTPGAFSGSQRLEIQPGMVAGEATPRLLMPGRFEVSEGSTSAHGALFTQEPGITVEGSYTLQTPASGASSVALVLEGKLQAPARLREVGILTHGKFKAEAGWAESGNVISANVNANLAQLDYRQFKTHSLKLQSRLSGSLLDPTLRATVHLQAAGGRMRGDMLWTQQNQLLKVFGADIDAAQLERCLGLNLAVEGGLLNLEATLRRAHGRFEGSLETSARGLRLRSIGSGDINISATVEHQTVSGCAQLEFNKLGSVDITATALELPAGNFDLSRLAKLHGALKAKGSVNLAQLSPLLESGVPSLEHAGGRVLFELAANNDAKATKGLQLSAAAETRGLSLKQKFEPATNSATTNNAPQSAPLALEGIDFRVAVRAAPSDGQAHGTLTAHDERGVLLEARAQAPLSGIWPPSSASLAALARTPLEAELQVPARRLETLPALLRPSSVAGTVRVDARISGSTVDPRIAVLVLINSLKTKNTKNTLDVVLNGLYARDGGDAQATASRAGMRVAELNTRWSGDLRRGGETAAGQGHLEATGDVRLTQFPFDAVPLLVHHQVEGGISGELRLTGWGRDARVDGRLESRELSFAKVKISDFTATARTSGSQLVSAIAFKMGGARTQASVSTAMHWGNQAVPRFEPRVVAKLATQNFELQALTPLLRDGVSELSGILNANATLTVTPKRAVLGGSAQLKHGVMQLPAMGQRFNDIFADVVVDNNQVRLKRLSARGVTGRLTAEGDALLDGLELRAANATVSISKNEKVPITIEGAAIGEAWGKVRLAYSTQASAQPVLQVNITSFTLLTPETNTHDLQSMAEDESIRIGVRRSDGTFVELPVQPLEPGGKLEAASSGPPLRIDVTLQNVTVERGQVAKVLLAGDLVVVTAPETRVSGRIMVRGGKIDVQGKAFEIEGGVVSFDGKDASNPTITATARWDSPSDHTVYAEYVGDVATGTIKVRSEPPLTQDEIASLLLFGTPDSSTGSKEADETALAVSVAGGTAAKGLNQTISDFTNLNLRTRIDTSTGSARPELVFQGTARLAAKVSRAVAEPAGGETPDRTFLTLEYRLRHSWVLSAVIGDRGASTLDLIWRHRY